MKKPKIISLGGSILIPGQRIISGSGLIDTGFIDEEMLSHFTLLIHELVQKGHHFVIIVGGGKINSHYVSVLRKMGIQDNFLLDTLGISATKFNATLLWAILRHSGLAYKQVVENPTADIRTTKPVIVGCGWEPGHSTDTDAVLRARKAGARVIINASNTDYVYDKDPNRFPDAKPIETISWPDFRQMIDSRWQARMNAPFDPIASKLAAESGIKVIVLNGKNIPNFRAAIEGEKFIGTMIG